MRLCTEYWTPVTICYWTTNYIPQLRQRASLNPFVTLLRDSLPALPVLGIPFTNGKATQEDNCKFKGPLPSGSSTGRTLPSFQRLGLCAHLPDNIVWKELLCACILLLTNLIPPSTKTRCDRCRPQLYCRILGDRVFTILSMWDRKLSRSLPVSVFVAMHSRYTSLPRTWVHISAPWSRIDCVVPQ